MKTTNEPPDFRDTIATVDAEGHRRWIYSKKPEGRYYRWRTYVSWVLLAVLFGLPFVWIDGQPLVLLNIVERRFILFGLKFTPQDFHLFAILMITAVVFIALFTAIWGRLFCGWVCPQTIFMEMVFRKIEYWIEGDGRAQQRLAAAPWTREKIRMKVAKHSLFLLISALIAHTFLAYIIGIDQLWALISRSPLEAPGGFAAIVIFIGVFYFVFSYLREQVCIAICPYGRLQGVLLDNTSMAVIYDYERGEPRGKLKRSKGPKGKKSSCSSCPDCRDGQDSCSGNILSRMEAALAGEEISLPAPAPRPPIVLGDCIDCTLCVQVCPTGIDIRNGTQLECVNCTACMDACDAVMAKIDRPLGLIRYDSELGVATGKRKVWTPRVIAYSGVLLALIGLNVFLLGNRADVSTTLLRTPGLLYHINEDGSINNLYTYQLTNRTNDDLPIHFELPDVEGGKIRMVGKPPVARPGRITEGALFIDLPPDAPVSSKLRVTVWSGDRQIDVLDTRFIHPLN
ncbi:MAG: 4Fe-4S dicluster domain-containing protein [Saprospiraceae bacterium]